MQVIAEWCQCSYGTKKKKKISLPGDVHQHEEFKASRSMMVSSHDVILNQQLDLGRGR